MTEAEYLLRERANIKHFEGGITLEEAERQAQVELSAPQGELFDTRLDDLLAAAKGTA